MLQVELDHILPENDAYTRIREIIQHVEEEKEVYVITKDGRPAVAIISAEQLVSTENITASTHVDMPALGLGGFAVPATEPVAMPIDLPPFPPTLVEPFASPLPEPPSFSPFSEPLPPLLGTEHVNVAPPILPPTLTTPPIVAATLPPMPQFPPTLAAQPIPPIVQAPFSFPKEDLDNASPLG